jgi:hypothetical protein
MRTSGVASDTQLTLAVFLIALAFLVVLAGGPSQFMLAIQHTVEATTATIAQLFHQMRT